MENSAFKGKEGVVADYNFALNALHSSQRENNTQVKGLHNMRHAYLHIHDYSHITEEPCSMDLDHMAIQHSIRGFHVTSQ
jgi:hypothetical protein